MEGKKKEKEGKRRKKKEKEGKKKVWGMNREWKEKRSGEKLFYVAPTDGLGICSNPGTAFIKLTHRWMTR